MDLNLQNSKKIVILGCYFGKLPSNFDLWLKSCSYNSTIDWIVFTDQTLASPISNVRFEYIEFDDVKQLANSKLGMNVALNRPYKLCDFKPVYGVIFEDYIKNYDFWGHCDFDMIFGDIRRFITEEILEKFDKILCLGHLSIYRNTAECNNRYKLVTDNINYVDAFASNESYVFDELNGIYQIYCENNFPMYNEKAYADISNIYRRFKLSDMLDYILSRNTVNYKEQVFYWEDGKAFRAYKIGKNVYTEEYIYIHFKKRNFNKYSFDLKETSAFFITPYGFVAKNSGKLSGDEFKKQNPYYGKIYEFCEFGVFQLKTLYKNMKTKKINFNIKNVSGLSNFFIDRRQV